MDEDGSAFFVLILLGLRESWFYFWVTLLVKTVICYSAQWEPLGGIWVEITFFE